MSIEYLFQYGSTLIADIDNYIKSVLEFTFQYGSTLIDYTDEQYMKDPNLHSNMVLL